MAAGIWQCEHHNKQGWRNEGRQSHEKILLLTGLQAKQPKLSNTPRRSASNRAQQSDIKSQNSNEIINVLRQPICLGRGSINPKFTVDFSPQTASPSLPIKQLPIRRLPTKLCCCCSSGVRRCAYYCSAGLLQWWRQLHCVDCAYSLSPSPNPTHLAHTLFPQRLNVLGLPNRFLRR